MRQPVDSAGASTAVTSGRGRQQTPQSRQGHAQPLASPLAPARAAPGAGAAPAGARAAPVPADRPAGGVLKGRRCAPVTPAMIYYAALPGACTACSCVLSGCCRCACPGFEAAPRWAACACQQQNICWRLCEASCASMPCQGTRLCPDKHCVPTITVLAHQLGQRAPGAEGAGQAARPRQRAPPRAGAAGGRGARQQRHQPHAGLGSGLSGLAPTPRRQLQALDVALRGGVPCGSTITVTCRFRVRVVGPGPDAAAPAAGAGRGACAAACPAAA